MVGMRLVVMMPVFDKKGGKP